MAEWLKAAVLKTVKGESSSRSANCRNGAPLGPAYRFNPNSLPWQESRPPGFSVECDDTPRILAGFWQHACHSKSGRNCRNWVLSAFSLLAGRAGPPNLGIPELSCEIQFSGQKLDQSVQQPSRHEPEFPAICVRLGDNLAILNNDAWRQQS